MAKRRSGNVTVSIVWLDSKNLYRASVHANGKKRVIGITAPAFSRVAVDSPAAYDDAARAAIAFAEDEGLDVQPDYTASGIHVSRVAGKKRR